MICSERNGLGQHLVGDVIPKSLGGHDVYLGYEELCERTDRPAIAGQRAPKHRFPVEVKEAGDLGLAAQPDFEKLLRCDLRESSVALKRVGVKPVSVPTRVMMTFVGGSFDAYTFVGHGVFALVE